MRAAGRPTVMVAHSHGDTRSLLRLWLEYEGYDVVEAADGQEVVELTLGKCPDLLLMSERMSKLGGLETTRLILSSYPSKEAHAAAVKAGCDSFIPQPVDFDLLGELLGRLLRGASDGRRAAARGEAAVAP
jgi:CheY-like chemotaxis protein